MRDTLKVKAKILLSLLTLFIFAASNAFAHSTDVHSGSWNTTTTSLGIATGPSVSSYLSSFQTWYSSWNGISSNAGLSNPYEQSTLDDTPHFSRINIIGKDLGSTGAWADTCNYTYSVIWGYSCNWSGSWKDSIIRINTNTDSTTKVGYSFIGADLRKKVFLHELGHSFGLKHPADTSEVAIMKQGNNNYYTIQPHDKDTLKSKYGN